MNRSWLLLTLALPLFLLSETQSGNNLKPNITFDSLDVVSTYYNPVSAQCDSEPLITADGSKINLKDLKKEKIRWVAVSRDLLKRNGGRFNYKDTLEIVSNHPHISGRWVVVDCLNKRYKKHLDFLDYDQVEDMPDSVTIIIENLTKYN